MSNDDRRGTWGIGRAPRTALERSLRPSCLLTALVLVAIVAVFRVRLPPMPYAVLVVLGIGLVCFLVILFWESGRGRR